MSAAFLQDTMANGEAPKNSQERSGELTETLVACQSRISLLTKQHKKIMQLENLARECFVDADSQTELEVCDSASVAPNMIDQSSKPSPEGNKIKQLLGAILIASVSAVALTALASQSSFADDLDSGVSFVDEFQSLDASRWYISDGWANGDHQNCIWSKDAASVSNDMLVLEFKPQAINDRDYACGEIQTYGRFGYGVYEARIKTGSGSGLNAAFFTYIGPTHKKPHDEIDFEFLLKDTTKVQINYYVTGKGGNEALIPLTGRSSSEFNDYAFVWKPGQLLWYINGELIHQTSVDDVLPANLQKIYFSHWGSETFVEWMGPFSGLEEPVQMLIDRVAFTGLNEPCQFAESLACNLNSKE